MRQRPATTSGTPCSTLFEQCVGAFTSRRVVNTEELRDGTYGPYPSKWNKNNLFELPKVNILHSTYHF